MDEDIQEPQDQPQEPLQAEPVETQVEQQQEAERPAVDPHAGSKALLETLSEPDPNAPKAEDQSAEKPEAKPEPKPEQPQTPEQEEAALLDGVKSERGKERIKAMLAERKQAQSELTEFREMVVSTGMSPQQFAQSLEFGRLVNSGQEADKRTALAMLDAARADLVKELGIEAPGVDPLADYPDLVKSVEGMEVSRERALEIAKYRRREEVRQREEHALLQSRQSTQQFQQQIEQAGQTAEAYFATRAREADYQVKMAQIQAYFKNPENVQQFVATFPPETWVQQFRFMYDNIRIAPAPRAPQPISSRPTNTGQARSNPDMPPVERMLSRIDSMGL